MRPVSLRFCSFGPYLEEQYVDFAALEKGGLFLIAGDTGSGKTTILDAMCCALYGESSGGSRGSLEVMRCKTAQKEDPTTLEFVFDHNGKRYVFTRELKFARKHINDHHNCMIEQDGVRVPLLENPTKSAVNRMAESIIGLTVGQFRQVIILPQGKFETLLTSDSAAKETILTSIFDAEKWDAIAASITAQVKERDAALKAEAASLHALWSRYACDGVATMRERLASDTAALEEQNARLLQAQEAYTAMQKTLEDMIAAEQPFKELGYRRAQYEALCKENADTAEETARLARADEAARLSDVYDPFDAARQAATRADEAVTRAKTALDTAVAAEAQAYAAFTTHRETAASVEAMSREAVNLQEKRALYESLPEKREAVQAATEQVEYIADGLAAAKEELAACEDRLLRCRERQAQAIAACEEAEGRYFSGIGGVLAATLKAGQPCPVCGSEHHPAPASRQADSISEEEFKAYKERRAEAIAAFDAAQNAAVIAREKVTVADGRRQQAQSEQAAAQSAWETALSLKVAGIDTAAQLAERLCECEKAKAQYDTVSVQLQEALMCASGEAQAAKALLAQCEQTAAKARTTFGEAATAWLTALETASFVDEAAFLAARLPFEEREQRKAAQNRVKAALEHARAEVALWQERVGDTPRPQVEAQKAQNEQAAAALEDLRREVTLAQNAVEALERDTADAEKRLAVYSEARQKTDADLEFSRRISGSSGISLKRYVLGVMLTNITVQANLLLSQVYGGRYRLYRTDDIAGSGHKGGLELEVLDSYSNERRSVTTLSGGEKFLVALSLAIGLSAVVQAQGSGVRLEAMFVDEGFGSLSREAVDDAIEILQGVQRSSGIVGIISHVDKLAETIPNRIEITKTSKGSHLKVITN